MTREEKIIVTQKNLIEVLRNQVVDLSMMSKIELGDDSIAEIQRLQKELFELESSAAIKTGK